MARDWSRRKVGAQRNALQVMQQRAEPTPDPMSCSPMPAICMRSAQPEKLVLPGQHRHVQETPLCVSYYANDPDCLVPFMCLFTPAGASASGAQCPAAHASDLFTLWLNLVQETLPNHDSSWSMRKAGAQRNTRKVM